MWMANFISDVQDVFLSVCVCFFFKALTPGLYHYYVTELAFYWSLMFSQFTDIKRKVSACHYG